MSDTVDTTNLNTLWGSLLIGELVRCGVTQFCVAPGSRSTPLTVAVARHPAARHTVCLDERGAAFHALGHARATGMPAAVIGTSGTAIANFLPAVVEAAIDQVPLIVLSADRPPELRHTLANQTIDQPDIFGRYARWQFDLPTPTPDIPPAFVLTTVDQAVRQALRPPAGPVQLNCMFREPLAPTPAPIPPGYADGLAGWRKSADPYTRYLPTLTQPAPEGLERLAQLIAAAERGWLIVGQLKSAAEREAVAQFARRLGWPTFADITSGLRLGQPDTPFVPHYDLALLSTESADWPDTVIHIGGQYVSKRLLTTLQSSPPAHYAVIRPDPLRYDPTHGVTLRIEAELSTLFSHVIHRILPVIPGNTHWLDQWRGRNAAVAAAIAAAENDPFCEATVARVVARTLSADWGLFVGSSMPIRDLDQFAAADGAAVRVAANRGASGIDGTLACAAGFALGENRPIVLLVGDVTLLHDLNSLLLIARSPQPVVVVLINNQGGGIFHFLPIAQFDDLFETFFGTPHTVQFGPLAAGFGLPHTAVRDRAGLEGALHAALAARRSALIEVQTERHANHAARQALQAAVFDNR
jgi:2-succinyl-5-enolpyruvyl-6-hydroxy-3-cyclohexene-1-carboxylate synthase